MALPFKARRALSITIPLFSALVFLGLFRKMGIDVTTNIANTGITIGLILGLLNLWLVYLVNNHMVP